MNPHTWIFVEDLAICFSKGLPHIDFFFARQPSSTHAHTHKLVPISKRQCDEKVSPNEPSSQAHVHRNRKRTYHTRVGIAELSLMFQKSTMVDDSSMKAKQSKPQEGFVSFCRFLSSRLAFNDCIGDPFSRQLKFPTRVANKKHESKSFCGFIRDLFVIHSDGIFVIIFLK